MKSYCGPIWEEIHTHQVIIVASASLFLLFYCPAPTLSFDRLKARSRCSVSSLLCQEILAKAFIKPKMA
ncbi:hypothetical protein PMIT1323_00804 [Prochlorococcus marinus str. MIT 1323]|nr:hypothetical protein PMIT1323_00804 [Prochlorococcus marinus str. MIT 1323]